MITNKELDRCLNIEEGGLALTVSLFQKGVLVHKSSTFFSLGNIYFEFIFVKETIKFKNKAYNQEALYGGSEKFFIQRKSSDKGTSNTSYSHRGDLQYLKKMLNACKEEFVLEFSTCRKEEVLKEYFGFVSDSEAESFLEDVKRINSISFSVGSDRISNFRGSGVIFLKDGRCMVPSVFENNSSRKYVVTTFEEIVLSRQVIFGIFERLSCLGITSLGDFFRHSSFEGGEDVGKWIESFC